VPRPARVGARVLRCCRRCVTASRRPPTMRGTCWARPCSTSAWAASPSCTQVRVRVRVCVCVGVGVWVRVGGCARRVCVRWRHDCRPRTASLPLTAPTSPRAATTTTTAAAATATTATMQATSTPCLSATWRARPSRACAQACSSARRHTPTASRGTGGRASATSWTWCARVRVLCVCVGGAVMCVCARARVRT
jgi:hypothetical protein